jgi:adenylate cyclase
LLHRLIPARFAPLFRRHRRSPWVPRAVALLICVAVFAAVAGARRLGWLEYFELKGYDVLLATQPTDDSVSKDMLVVGMDDSDIETRKLAYPMSDATMADLLGKILAGNPRAVGVDIYRDRPNGENGWTELVERLKDPRVVTVIRFAPDGTVIGVPPARDIKPSQLGFADLPTDSDGRVRRAMLFFTDPAGTQYRAMGVRLATRYLDAVDPALKLRRLPEKGPEWFALGKATYRLLRPGDGAYVRADTRGNQIRFDFRGARRYTPTTPVSAVLRGEVPPSAFSGKVVVIGMTATSTKDLVNTAVVNDQFGPEVHAVLAEQLIRAAVTGRSPPDVWPDWAENLWTAGWVLLGGLLGLVVRRPAHFIATIAVAAAVLVGVVFFAFSAGLWLPSLPPLVGFVAAATFVAQYMAHHEQAERMVLNELFKRIVDEDVAETLWARRDELIEEGHLAAKEVRATLLFTDLQDFTTITEAMDKSCLMAFLNDYMAVMSGVVGGKPDAFVNKYIGDAIMAVFGPPLERTEAQSRTDAVNAVECALEMRAKLIEHAPRWEALCADGIRRKLAGAGDGGDKPVPPMQLRMRIGIQSGFVTAGSLGSKQRLEYTVIGDTVNTAARLESFDKELMPPDLAAGGCRILIGQDTLALLPAGGEYLTREVGSIKLKGKEQRVTIHGVIGRAPAPGAPPIAPPPAAGSGVDNPAGATKVSTGALTTR